MSFADDIFDISRLELQGDFDSQVTQLLQAVRLSREEVENLQVLLNDLTATLENCWPGCVVHPFGSIITGLGIKGSDVDCYVALTPSTYRMEKLDKKIVYKAKFCLQLCRSLFTDVVPIPMAKVPIVKFFHIPTSTHGDVNFKSPSGVQNSKLIAHLLHAHPQALSLAVLIKYWSKVHKLTGTNLMPSYALTILVVFFFQVRGLLPAVHKLQATIEPLIIDDWNTAFQEVHSAPTSKSECLFTLLGEFFVYYSKFDFRRQVICPFLGQPLSIDNFIGTAQLPPQFRLYMDNLAQGFCRTLKIDSAMCVQDPFEHCRNCAVAVFPRLAQKIVNLFKSGAEYYKQGKSDFLKNILTVQEREEEVKPHGKPTNAQGKVHKRAKQNYGTKHKLKNNIMFKYNQARNRYKGKC